MSFILDALRKSENERRQGAVPGITQVPPAVHKQALPRWALGVMLGLGLGVVGLTGAWWTSVRSGPDAATPIARAPDRGFEQRALSLPPPASSLADAARPRSPAAASGDEASTEPAVQTARPPTAAAASTSLRVTAAQSGPAAVGTAPRRPAAALPNAAALAAQGVTVPELELQLHVYDAVATERYVFINGRMYREGETLRDGPRLVSIEREGAVLSQQGREFLLSQ